MGLRGVAGSSSLCWQHTMLRSERKHPLHQLWLSEKKIIFSSHLQNFSKSILQKPLSVPHSTQLVKEGGKKNENTKKKSQWHFLKVGLVSTLENFAIIGSYWGRNRQWQSCWGFLQLAWQSNTLGSAQADTRSLRTGLNHPKQEPKYAISSA